MRLIMIILRLNYVALRSVAYKNNVYIYSHLRDFKRLNIATRLSINANIHNSQHSAARGVAFMVRLILSAENVVKPTIRLTEVFNKLNLCF